MTFYERINCYVAYCALLDLPIGQPQPDRPMGCDAQPVKDRSRHRRERSPGINQRFHHLSPVVVGGV